MVSPTQRSLKALRAAGWQVAVVERWNPFVGPKNPKTGRPVGIRQDLWGFGDLLGCDVTRMIAIWQVTSGSNLAARRTKILAEPRAKVWLQAGGYIWLHGWAKQGARGKRKVWTCRIEQVTLDDFTPLADPPTTG